MSQGARLRKRLATGRILAAPGVYDALGARLVEQAGFEAMFVSGAAMSASLLGLPDLGLMTVSESLDQTRRIVTATSRPVIADCDTGYGNPLNVRRTVREFEAAGVAALFIEDQTWPKKCGHFDGKELISGEEMVQKVRAAAEARENDELMVIARTDAIAVDGLDAAVQRARAYSAAGADMIFLEAPESVEHLEYALANIDVPLMVNLVEGGRTPLFTVEELDRLGVGLVTFSGTIQKTAINAIQSLLAQLAETGDLASLYPSRIVSLEERSAILRMPELMDLQARYTADVAEPLDMTEAESA
jgi:2-methylisocitrate lyase-like PEP mutase family enzyme